MPLVIDRYDITPLHGVGLRIFDIQPMDEPFFARSGEDALLGGAIGVFFNDEIHAGPNLHLLFFHGNMSGYPVQLH